MRAGLITIVTTVFTCVATAARPPQSLVSRAPRGPIPARPDGSRPDRNRSRCLYEDNGDERGPEARYDVDIFLLKSEFPDKYQSDVTAFISAYCRLDKQLDYDPVSNVMDPEERVSSEPEGSDGATFAIPELDCVERGLACMLGLTGDQIIRCVGFCFETVFVT